MNEDARGIRRAISWIGAICIGIAACILTATLLGVAAGALLPDLGDDASVASDIYGVLIWLVSVGVGISQIARYRPRK